MPRFCSKCGTAAQEGLKFCPKCGNALAEPSAPPAGPTPASVAPAAQKGSPVLKIVLVVVGVLFLIMVIAMAGVLYVGYRVKKRADAFKQTFKVGQSGESVTIQTPKGQVVIGESKEAESAITNEVPPYPGAKTLNSGGVTGPGGTGYSGVEYETADSVDKVVAFYKEKLGSKITLSTQTETGAVLQVTTSAEVLTISVTRETGGATTKISISRVTK